MNYVRSSNDNNSGSSLLTIAHKLGLPNQNNNIDPGYDLLSWMMIPVYLKSKMISEKIIEKDFYSNRYSKKVRLLNILLSSPDTSTQFTESERRFGLKKLQNSLFLS